MFVMYNNLYNLCYIFQLMLSDLQSITFDAWIDCKKNMFMFLTTIKCMYHEYCIDLQFLYYIILD